MFLSYIFGSDNYEPSYKEKRINVLFDKCEKFKKDAKQKRLSGLDNSSEMKQWKDTLTELNSLIHPAQP